VSGGHCRLLAPYLFSARGACPPTVTVAVPDTQGGLATYSTVVAEPPRGAHVEKWAGMWAFCHRTPEIPTSLLMLLFCVQAVSNTAAVAANVGKQRVDVEKSLVGLHQKVSPDRMGAFI
jgi:hypothetical protein